MFITSSPCVDGDIPSLVSFIIMCVSRYSMGGQLLYSINFNETRNSVISNVKLYSHTCSSPFFIIIIRNREV